MTRLSIRSGILLVSMFLMISAWTPSKAVKAVPKAKAFMYYFYTQPDNDYQGYLTIADMIDELEDYYGVIVSQTPSGTVVAKGYLAPWSQAPSVWLYAHLPLNP